MTAQKFSKCPSATNSGQMNCDRLIMCVKASENMQKESLRPFGSGREGIRQKILDQKQTESTVPGLKGIDTGLLELMRRRAGGGDVPQK